MISRYRGKFVERLVASRLACVVRRCDKKIQGHASHQSYSSHSRSTAQPHRADTCAWSGIGARAEPTPEAHVPRSAKSHFTLRHCLARARRQTRQLCARSTRYRTQLRRLRWLLSLVPTDTNCRDCRRKHSCAPNKKDSRGRETSSGQPISNRAARLRPAKVTAIVVSTARLLLRRNPRRPHCENHSCLRLRRQASRPAVSDSLHPNPAVIPFRSAAEDSEQKASRSRDCAGR